MSRSRKIVVVGAHWGDEGKAKVVDNLVDNPENTVMVRFAGGANTGATLVIDGQKFVGHQLPVGVVRPGLVNIMGPYVACDLEALVLELRVARENGAPVMIDPRAPIVLPMYKALDRARDGGGTGPASIGTTGKGMGPTYAAFASRYALRVGDIVRGRNHLMTVRDRIQAYHVELLAGLESCGVSIEDKAFEFEAQLEQCLEYAAEIGDVVGDTVRYVRGVIAKSEKDVLFEGSQSIMLDVLHGWPYCTSCFTGIDAIGNSFGIRRFDQVVGVIKAYSTRVGRGPFPTEMDEFTANIVRERGGEYGSTTGRPRRCGWLDLPALRYAVRMGGITCLVMTKADVLCNLMTIPVATGYLDPTGTQVLEDAILDTELLAGVKAVYQSAASWAGPLTLERNLSGFPPIPAELVAYMEQVERATQVSIRGLSIGPDRKEMIWFERP